MKCAYKQTIEKMNNERFDNQEKTVVLYAHCLALLTAEKCFGFDAEKLNTLEKDMYIKATEGFMDYKDEDAENYDSDTVPFLEHGFRNRLEASGVDVKGIEHKFDVSAVKAPSLIKVSHSHRRVYESRLNVVKSREVQLKAYWYSLMLCLAEDYGIEGEELANFYCDLRERYYKLWQHYLYLSQESDRYLSAEVHKTINACKDKGINPSISDEDVTDRYKDKEEHNAD